MSRKINKFRLCIDPAELKKALKRQNYQMPTIEEILPELSNAKVFTLLDAKNGFWQLQLDETSSKMTTFWTPFGRFKVLPFGVKPAPENFQHELLHGLQGVEVIADDILVFGKGNTMSEALLNHNKNLGMC